MFEKIRDNYHDLVEIYAVDKTTHLLNWLTGIGIGHLKSDGYEYGEAYWEIYQKYGVGDVGEKLTQARINFVKKNLGSMTSLCDVGVGNGQFVDTVKCKGTDVNPVANEWLKQHGYYVDDISPFQVLTFWDVLEHIEDPTDILKNAKHVFVSTPIYSDAAACLKSKHLKPGEHIWYFTDTGIKNYMDLFGFVCKDTSDCETQLGRESIMSYYFTRV
jgi:hypothetical protein